MKRIMAAIFGIIILFMPAYAQANESLEEEIIDEEALEEETKKALQEGIDAALDELDLGKLEEVYENNELLGDSLREAINKIANTGLSDITLEQAFRIVLDELLACFKGKIATIAQILIMLVIMSLLKHLNLDFSKSGVTGAAFMAGYTIISMLAANILIGTVENAKQGIASLTGVTEAVTPLLTALLTGMAGSSGMNVLSPLMSALTGTIFIFIDKAIFPAILIMTVLAMISGFSSEIDLGGFVSLGEKGIKWILGIISIVFIGLITIKGIGAGATDGIYFKTAKYTVEKMVPVVGGMFSDTLDTLMTCGVIVKNAIGTVGLILLAAKLIAPILSIGADILLLKMASAVAVSLGAKGSQDMLASASKMAELANVTLIVCSAMAFISIALLMGSVGISFMMG